MLRYLIGLPLLSFLITASVWAQPAVQEPGVSARELLEAEKQVEELVEQRTSTDTPTANAQATPLAAMLGLRAAIRANDYDAFGKFLDRRYIDEELESYTDQQLLTALSYVFNRQNIIDQIGRASCRERV